MGLAHKVTDKCGDVCACILQKKEVGECCLWRCQVKVLEITGYGGSSKELKQMGHFLEKLKRLEIVKVGVQQENNNHDTLSTYGRFHTFTEPTEFSSAMFVTQP
ncbi:hypothetical protein F2Q69_00035735 [Brassica cretica]|uniref:FBD domain-containing protein n=1 Tax=Brassica cretica TaxID=69181 RepID=A0A8S9SPX3_BRACR|nr:hypothetical protein F2Q69_00035735 [Brassica cretica]